MREKLLTLEHRRAPITGQMHLTDEPPVMYCNRCGQRLRTPLARKRGYGRTCWKMKKAEQ